MRIEVVKDILSANEQIAAENRKLFETQGTTAINVMASPGAGKTSLIIRTIDALNLPLSVIEGDIASVYDAEKVGRKNVPVVQINTGGECHLDAAMIRKSLDKLKIEKNGFLFIENVGNLVCPAEFHLGEQVRVLVASIPEGDDKAFKYPAIFSTVQAIVLNKIDLLPYVDFSVERFFEGVRTVNATTPVFTVSCRTGEGLKDWVEWLKNSRS